MKALLIIDMQNGFSSARNQKTINECAKLIRRTKENHQTIIVVEYKGYGETVTLLVKLLKNYPYAHTIKKNEDNGGPEIHSYLLKNNLRFKEFDVCGVNSDCCVMETCESLAEMGYKIYIVKKACNSVSPPQEAWSKYTKMKNLRRI